MIHHDENEHKKNFGVTALLVVLIVGIVLICGCVQESNEKPATEQPTTEQLTKATYSIFGTVTWRGKGVEGFTITIASSSSDPYIHTETTTDENGQYSFVDLP